MLSSHFVSGSSLVESSCSGASLGQALAGSSRPALTLRAALPAPSLSDVPPSHPVSFSLCLSSLACTLSSMLCIVFTLLEHTSAWVHAPWPRCMDTYIEYCSHAEINTARLPYILAHHSTSLSLGRGNALKKQLVHEVQEQKRKREVKAHWRVFSGSTVAVPASCWSLPSVRCVRVHRWRHPPAAAASWAACHRGCPR